MPSIVTLTDEILEGTTPLYTANIVDENGDAIAVASLLTLTLTYFDVRSGTIINSRNAQNILNANNVTVATAGVPAVTTLTWTLQAADTALVNTFRDTEDHYAIFRWTWPGGRGAHWIQLTIKNTNYYP